VVLADAGYGNDGKFRERLTEWQLPYVAGIQSTVTVWKPGEQPKPAPKGKGRGRPPKLMQRDAEHRPVTVKDLALSLPKDAWRNISWRQGVRKKLASRFAALRVRPAHRDYWRAEPHPEEWLLIEWPKDEDEPIKYWLSTLPANTSPQRTLSIAPNTAGSSSAIIKLKQQLGLGHFEGRGWRGFHHHATLCIAAYGFLVSWFPRGAVFPPQSTPAILDYAPPGRQKASGQEAHHVRPERHNPQSIATIRRVIARYLLRQLPYCPCCGFRSG